MCMPTSLIPQPPPFKLGLRSGFEVPDLDRPGGRQLHCGNRQTAFKLPHSAPLPAFLPGQNRLGATGKTPRSTQGIWSHLHGCCAYDDGTYALARREYEEAAPLGPTLGNRTQNARVRADELSHQPIRGSESDPHPGHGDHTASRQDESVWRGQAIIIPFYLIFDTTLPHPFLGTPAGAVVR